MTDQPETERTCDAAGCENEATEKLEDGSGLTTYVCAKHYDDLDMLSNAYRRGPRPEGPDS
ncbi:hypothetical protein ACFQH6_15595 [Halobacteriaceae archaeon GCM10025711]